MGGVSPRTATIRIAGAGHATVQVDEALDATIEGTAVIEYLGSPTVTQEVTGLGVVRRLES